MVVQRVNVTESFYMQMFLAGAGNAAVIVMPQPCLDRVHGYRGSRQEIKQDPRFLNVFLNTF